MPVKHVYDLADLTMSHIEQVGGKNASLGEMIHHLCDVGVSVPGGFATSADSYGMFLHQADLSKTIYERLEALDVEDVQALRTAGQAIRQAIIDTPFQADMEQAVREAYLAMGENACVAVRSSATAEDLPDASFAGQQESFLNVVGIENVLHAIKLVFASLFNDRAIAYRVHHGFKHDEVLLSAGIQRMVRSDQGASGVMFTMDTESGYDKVVFITSSYGLGEMVVQGAVNPDEYYVFKPALEKGHDCIVRRTLGSKKQKMIFSDNPSVGETVKVIDVEEQAQNVFSLNDADVETLARYAVLIEKHYGRAMDIEWGKDGRDGKVYILQARPETVQSRSTGTTLERYQLNANSTVLSPGRSIGQRIGQGKARIIKDISQMDQVQPGDVLITDMTDPDWEPIMKRSAAIVTNRGGRTCHAAIIARELGIPAVVGCGDATKTIQDGDDVTVSCAEGDDGYVYQGLLPFEIKRLDVANMPDLPVKVMLNVGNPERAFAFQAVPNSGVGLARLEFLISNTIGIHPKALLNFENLPDPTLKAKIQKLIAAYRSPVEFYIERLKEGIATIASAFYPKRVIVRLSDFKSNEYANLIGGELYEPEEENPMLGFRGASRYVSDNFKDCFALECEAVKRVRLGMWLDNVEVMIPFVRSINEAENVIEILENNGLKRGEDGLKVIMMCELPTNALLAKQYLKYFDGFSIGSNDLTQLTLGLDRDSSLVAGGFDERDPAVKALLAMAIKSCKEEGKYVGICGQGPSDHKDFARWLMEQGIDSMSLNPDSVLETCLFLADEMAVAH
jgi:pyruvate,water dikinase